MTETCTSTDLAFADYGIADGSTLVTRTYYRLADRGRRDVEPTSAFLTALGRSFRDAYIHAAAVPLVPEAVDAAIEDALDVLAHRLLDDAGGPAGDGTAPDASDRDLRTDVLPAFYELVACFYCESPGRADEAVGIWFEGGGR